MADDTSPKKKLGQKIAEDSERGARKALLEELFYDFSSSKANVYKMNFIRGIFFGFGSVIGGTILVVVTVFLLTSLVDLPGGIGEFIQSIIDAMNTPR
ncbi:TPA: hypothetical protein DIV49_03525 [Candidatus Saccharibacteria bacterium]|nr:hypothetical protein [Candidatus Saccharibacteria bacterium]HRJ91341.1 DUF5665 domain-containing protein [Candidatus Saccharibacteria bacterium]